VRRLFLEIHPATRSEFSGFGQRFSHTELSLGKSFPPDGAVSNAKIFAGQAYFLLPGQAALQGGFFRTTRRTFVNKMPTPSGPARPAENKSGRDHQKHHQEGRGIKNTDFTAPQQRFSGGWFDKIGPDCADGVHRREYSPAPGPGLTPVAKYVATPT